MTKIISKDHQVLLVDDDPSVTASIAMLLKQNGFRVLLASCQDEAIKHLENHSISLVIQDMNFSRNTSGKEGMILLNQIKNGFPAIPVILMTAWGSIELAVDGIKQGATDFITKPWDNQQLLRIVNTCLELNQSKVWELNTRQMLDEKYDFSGIVAENPAMLKVLTTIGRVAATDAAVLILGESGTGKELIADAIHINSRRLKQQFVKVNFDVSNLPIGSLTLDEMEKLMVKKAIKAYNNNLSKVAEALGISRSALYRRIEKHDLSS